MLWGKPSAEWRSSTKLSPQVSLFPISIFGVNICPFNYGIKDDFISELTINAQRPQAESAQHPFFPPNRWSFRPDPNPSSSTFQASILKWRTKTKLFRLILSSSGSFGITFLKSHLKFFFCPLLFLIGSSCRNLDSCRGSISILFPRARRNLRPFWVHCSRIQENSLQNITVETPWVVARFQELAPAPNCRL
jgi:hypothetical protein